MIVYVDRSTIREGHLEELKEAMDELVAFVEANEPDILSYHVHFDLDEDRMTVVHTHMDRASLEAHFEIAGDKFAPIGAFIQLESIDVYGDPGEDLVKRLKDKAATLGQATVTVHPVHRGFDRFTPP